MDLISPCVLAKTYLVGDGSDVRRVFRNSAWALSLMAIVSSSVREGTCFCARDS